MLTLPSSVRIYVAAERVDLRRLLDELPGGFHQVAILRKLHCVPVPKAMFIEVRNLAQGVVLPPVRIA